MNFTQANTKPFSDFFRLQFRLAVPKVNNLPALKGAMQDATRRDREIP
jgi:hypothetical protein